MSAILRLYPRAWRERYGDELVVLLEERPASPVDQLDLIRGALDARLHPQVPGSATAPDKEIPVNQRLLGAMAAIGGIAWTVGVASIFVLQRDAFGDRNLTLAMIGLALAIAFIGIALGELGTRQGSASSRRTGRAISAVSIVLALTLPVIWLVFLFGLFVFPIMAALLAIRGTRNGVFPGWFAVVSTAAAFAVLGGVGIDAQAGKDQTLVLLAVVGLPPLLLAWLALRGTAAPSAAPPEPDPA
jgi:hypothetical protein